MRRKWVFYWMWIWMIWMAWKRVWRCSFNGLFWRIKRSAVPWVFVYWLFCVIWACDITMFFNVCVFRYSIVSFFFCRRATKTTTTINTINSIFAKCAFWIHISNRLNRETFYPSMKNEERKCMPEYSERRTVRWEKIFISAINKTVKS